MEYQSSDAGFNEDPSNLFDNDDSVVDGRDSHRGSDEDYREVQKDDGEVEGEGEDEVEREDPEKKGSHFTTKFKELLLSIQQEYEERVAKAVANEGKNVNACWRFLNENTEPPREISPFNAFQSWYADNGEFERAENGMSFILSYLYCY